MYHVLTHVESTPVRVCFCVVFLTLLALFVVPAVVGGIVNLGNVVGAVVSAMGLYAFACNGRLSALVDAVAEKPVGRVVLEVLSVVVAVCVLLAVVVSGAMVLKMDDYPSEPSNLVVLGCKVKGTKPSLMLQRRLDTAYDYLVANPGTVAVVSGGKGDDEQVSEAECMKEYLVGRGIPEDRVIMEDGSTNTYENFKYSKEVLEGLGLPTDSVTVVTDGYHQLRASMVAKELGFKTYSISAKTSWYLVPTYFVREWFGVVHQYLFG
jgi:uncharacterized SAM-binding protein YcdF (DUF218 family)